MTIEERIEHFKRYDEHESTAYCMEEGLSIIEDLLRQLKEKDAHDPLSRHAD